MATSVSFEEYLYSHIIILEQQFCHKDSAFGADKSLNIGAGQVNLLFAYLQLQSWTSTWIK